MNEFLEIMGLIFLLFSTFVLGAIFGITLFTLITKTKDKKEITALLSKLRRLFL